jgi:hypothetical protein
LLFLFLDFVDLFPEVIFFLLNHGAFSMETVIKLLFLSTEATFHRLNSEGALAWFDRLGESGVADVVGLGQLDRFVAT